MQPTPRTILIAGNQGGGQFKSTTIASPWRRYQTETLKSITPQAEWLIG